ncbi:conserved hypothetical protein [Limnobacter sp. 130]|uniref:hypothetical protein n=1 Tax=Limnobacter sp. 130 TaxID=2653147 RepID=UPI0012F0ECCB|nr:hypothetical protein [Limnobacter sp. 130]VWX34135.1 conserved hypothetical protein [Limnobacter sp. 130]
MKRSIEKVAIPLDWLWPMKISKFIHELHSRDFEEIDRKVRAVLSPVFALIPELTISGALENRINPSTHREEVFYQPVLIASRQLQLQFDVDRAAKIEVILKSCLEEFARLPMMLETLLQAQQLKPLKSLSPQEYQAFSILRSLLDSHWTTESWANNHHLKTIEQNGPDTEHRLSFQATVRFKGRQSVVLESVRWHKTNPVIVNQKTFPVRFRPSYLFDEENNYLDRFEKLLRSGQPANFICRISLKKRKGMQRVNSATIEQLIDE